MLSTVISRQVSLQKCPRRGQKPSCSPRQYHRHSRGSPRHALPQQKQLDRDLNSNDENGATEGLGKASPDVLRLFSETQRNLLELNRSRLSALDELRVANNKISELEVRQRNLLELNRSRLSALDELRVANNKISDLEGRQRTLLELNQSRLSASDELRVANNKISDLEGRLEKVTTRNAEPRMDTAHTDSEQQATTPNVPSAQQPATRNVITVAYETGWKRVMMHYSADGQKWTELPGVEMQSGSDDLAGAKVVQVRGHKLEFVLNDGAGQWDTPDPYGSSQNKNYTITAPGRYRLQAGRLIKLD